MFKIIKSYDYDKYFTGLKKTTTILKNSKSIIITGFAGNEFWNKLMNYSHKHPMFSKSRSNLIDEYSRIVLNESLKYIDRYTKSHKIIFPFGKQPLLLDFITLGKLSGVGVDSILGLLINPEYGTWISFRGAILTDIEFDNYNSPLEEFNPCKSCTKPCISACPANTITESGWNWKRCINFRLKEDTCNNNCYSRRACPYGLQHQYSNEQFAHHHKFVIKDYKN